MKPSEEIFEKLNQIEALLHDLDKIIPLVAEDWEDPMLEGDTLFHFNSVKRHFGESYANYDAAVWPSFETGLTLANGAKLESLESTPRVGWDHQGLAKRVAQRIVDESVDWETGEVLKTPDETIRELLKYVGVGYWKVKPLKAIGIDPDQYSKPKDPVKSVKITIAKG